ncbi:MAG: two-component regulator propeller domain-containing protein [Ferruginibacter sp.]
MRCRTLILFFLISITHLSAQQHSGYIFRNITQSDGLLHNSVLSIAQDDKGFIWILTSNGLQRYDGSRFVNYHDIVNSPSSSFSNGAELYIDKALNEAWVLKEQELEKLDIKKNIFTKFNVGDFVADTTLKENFYRDENNQRVLLNDKGVFFYNEITRKYIPSLISIYPIQSNKSSYFTTDSIRHQSWGVGGQGLLLFDKQSARIYSKNYNPINHPLLQQMLTPKKAWLRLIHQDSNQNIWLGSWSDYFFRYNKTTQELTRYSLAEIQKKQQQGKKVLANTLLISGFFEDNHHVTWIITENAGLLKYNDSTDDFEYFIADENNRQAIQYNYKIFCIFQDREENIWLGTDKGINIFNPYRQHFKAIRNEKNNNASMPLNEIDCIIQNNQSNILVGTWGGGLTIFDKQWNFKRNINFKDEPDKNLVWCFQQNDDGNIWAGCQHGYIHIIDPSTEKIETIHPAELENSTVRCMKKDSAGNIWLGLHNGKIIKWDKLNRKFYPWKEPIHASNYPLTSISNIYIDKAQRCWISTDKGFKQFDLYRGEFTHTWLPDEQNKNAISGLTCQGIESYDDSTLLIGTIYGGINVFNIISQQFLHLNTSNGLPSNSIYALKKDKAGFIWFTTDYDLYKFKYNDKKIDRYNIGPGVINAAFQSPEFYALQDGRWVTSTATEIFCFQPNRNVNAAGINTKVEITGFKIFDSTVFINTILDAKNAIHLNYKQNFITIEFASLNFSNLQHTKYYYKLNGVDQDWVVSDTKKFASYTNLQPGTYSFSVKTEGDAGRSDSTNISIIITPPFWQTLFFKVIVILAIAGISYWLIVKRIKAIRHEAQMKQKIAETEMMALRAQMNPHFIFNCLNSIDNLIQINDKEKATLYLSKFAKLIRSILENSKNNVVPCWKDMETLELYLQLESLRFDNKFSYTVNVANEVINGDYKVPPLVIQPFVENAIHHGLLNKIGEDKKLQINVRALNNHIYYSIEDNGVGRDKAASYKKMNNAVYESMGMQITTERIKLFNQQKDGWVKVTDLVDKNKIATGTKVEITLLNKP